jgi:hypothetical protein
VTRLLLMVLLAASGAAFLVIVAIFGSIKADPGGVMRPVRE